MIKYLLFFLLVPSFSWAEYFPQGYVGKPIWMDTMQCYYKSTGTVKFEAPTVLQFIWGYFPGDPISNSNKSELLNEKKGLLHENKIEKIPVEILEWYPEDPSSPDCIYEGFETRGILEGHCKDFYGMFTRDIKLDFNFIKKNNFLRTDAILTIKNTPIDDDEDLDILEAKGECWDLR